MKLDNIQSVQKTLHEFAIKDGFYSNEPDDISVNANDFMKKFCDHHDLTSNTISPFRWRIESDKYGLLDDGVIELRNINNEDNVTAFKFVDISNAKIT